MSKAPKQSSGLIEILIIGLTASLLLVLGAPVLLGMLEMSADTFLSYFK